MGAATDFYADLWQEYTENREDSVLFAVLDPDREPNGSEGRTGSAGRLRRCRDAFESGALTPQAYARELLGILCRRRKLYQPGYETAGGDWLSPAHLVAPLVCAALGQALPAQLNRSQLHRQLETVCRRLAADDAETLARLQAALAGDALGRALADLCPRVEPDYRSALQRQARELRDGRSYLLALTRQVLDCAVHQEIKQFFYDRGFAAAEPGGAQKRRAANGAPETEAKPARVKTGKTLALLDRWVERYGSWPGREACPVAAPVSAEQCEQVFAVLLQSGREDVLFPLRVDPVTGCALYIVGKQYYRQWYRRDPDPRRRAQALGMLKRDPKCCCYAVLRLDRSGPDGRPGFLLHDTGFDSIPSAKVAMEDFTDFCDDAAEELAQALRGLPPAAFAAFALPLADEEPDALDRQAVVQADRAELMRLARPRGRTDKAARKAGP